MAIAVLTGHAMNNCQRLIFLSKQGKAGDFATVGEIPRLQ
jgi:hypothetical protein